MHSELDQAPVFPIRVDGVAAEEHRVPTVSRLELGGGQQGQEDRERGKKWESLLELACRRGLTLVEITQAIFFREGDPLGVLSRAPLPRKFQGWNCGKVHAGRG